MLIVGIPAVPAAPVVRSVPVAQAVPVVMVLLVAQVLLGARVLSAPLAPSGRAVWVGRVRPADSLRLWIS